MTTLLIARKRKNIDLPSDALLKLSIMAATQGVSVKAYIENILVSKAQSFEIKIKESPSPSGDPFFDDPNNLACLEERIKASKNGNTQASVTLTTPDEIKKFMEDL